MAPLILIADDDGHIREVIRFALEKAGMDVIAAKDGAEAMRLFGERKPELIVLDVGMPELDGLDVCRQLRRTSDVPILFLSARDEEIDRILGLEMGGDDYVTKPFSPRELVARVKIILKRRLGPLDIQETKNTLAQGGLQLDVVSHVADFSGKKLDLTALEFAILKAFLGHKQRAFTRDQIIDAAYAANMHVSDRTIDSHIRNIRAKLNQAGCPSVIETVHGVGFRLGSCEHLT
jgi:two-component system, OmpR family, response regulator